MEKEKIGKIKEKEKRKMVGRLPKKHWKCKMKKYNNCKLSLVS
jgi:hypothetical protein